MIDFVKKHPLLTCMIVALLLRLCSVVFSKGFMANDDHFETVQVAYNGIQNGLLDDQGHWKWNAMKASEVGRAPLYTLFNYSTMKTLEWLGVYNLEPMMYVVRLLHALLSLLIVWYGFKYVSLATGNKNYAVIAGMILAGHFLMPYLSVRNLIEMVSADLLVPSVYYAYRGIREENARFLLLAGILGGLAWVIRFNTGLAVIAIPFAVWFLARRIRPALYFVAGFILIALFCSSLDAIYLGQFGRSTYNIFQSFLYVTKTPPLPNPIWTFPALLLGVFIPPFSLYFIFCFFRKRIIRENLILFSAAATFFIIHSFITHKEERFMIPIFPLIAILGVIGLHDWLKNRNHSTLSMKIFRYSAIFAIFVNILILPLFTFNYAHKGMVEPFVYLSEQPDVRAILIDRIERKRYLAITYAGYIRPDYFSLNSWEDFRRLSQISSDHDSANYFIIFSDQNTTEHVDSLSNYYGKLERVFHSPPSLMDRVLHFLNPGHNHTNEAYVYRKADNSTEIPKGS